MCDTLKLTSSEVKLLKNKDFNKSDELSPLVKLVNSLFSRARYSLSRDRVAVVSNSFKKPCVLKSFFFKKILTANFTSPLQALIQINRFKADSIIIERKFLPMLSRHLRTGATQHRYKNIYVLSDESIDESACDLLMALELTIDNNPNSVHLVAENRLTLAPALEGEHSSISEPSDIIETTALLESSTAPDVKKSKQSGEEFDNVTKVNFIRPDTLDYLNSKNLAIM